MSGTSATGGAELPELESLRYEDLVGLLEDLTRQMSSGEVGIEEAARLYEQAGLVHRAAEERLERVTERLAAMGAAGTVETGKPVAAAGPIGAAAGDPTPTGPDAG